ncbi:hypothetical protein FACS1894102_3210 [Spirochaetia bacterium]|nr:hypothetical protein FACS1894102_3210 [Spirochaetia bacterium]
MKLKKQIVFLAFFVMAGSATFVSGLEFSFGGGAILGGSWSKSVIDLNGHTFYFVDLDIVMDMSYKTNSFDIGPFIFADCKYAELSAAYIYQNGNVTDISGNVTSPQAQVVAEPDKPYETHNVVIDLLGKYPFSFGEKLSVFPALGIGVKLALGGNEQSDHSKDILWGLSLKAGGGADFNLTDALFIRGEILYSFQIASDKDGKLNQYMGPLGDVPLTFKAKNEGYYMGPQVKLAIGYKLGAKSEEKNKDGETL